MTKKISKKIVISGTFGTGKTSLISLLQELGLPVIQETARDVLKQMGLKNNELTYDQRIEFQKKLICLQAERESSFVESGFITDTGLFENLVYSQDLHNYEELVDMVQRYYKGYDVIFICSILQNLEDDGLRYTDAEYQQVIQNRIYQIYRENNFTIIELGIQGETTQEQIEFRLQQILSVI